MAVPVGHVTREEWISVAIGDPDPDLRARVLEALELADIDAPEGSAARDMALSIRNGYSDPSS